MGVHGHRSGMIGAVVLAAMVTLAACGGISAGVGVDPDARVIKLGELAPLNGPVAVFGIPLARGREAYFAHVNEGLGGAGRDLPRAERFKLETVSLDSAFSVETHQEKFAELSDEVLALVQSFGTPHTKAILEQADELGMLVGAGTMASEWVAEENVVLMGAPYSAQVINAVQHLSDEGMLEGADVGVIYQGDSYGADGLKGLEFAAKEFGFEVVANATYKPSDSDFEAQVETMKTAGVTIVFLVTVPSATEGIAVAAKDLGYAPRMIGLSSSWVQTLAKDPDVADFLAEALWIVGDSGCGWGDVEADCEGMAELLAHLEAYASDQEPDYYYLLGYIQARIFHEIVEQAIERGDLTRGGMVDAFNDLTSVDLDGLRGPLSYGPDCEDRIPTSKSSIHEVDPPAPLGLSIKASDVDSPEIAGFPYCEH